MFRAEDPGGVELASPDNERAVSEGSDDPNKAGIRVDLSGIGARRP